MENELKMKPIPKPREEIGIDIDNEIVSDIYDGATEDKLDMNALESFLSVAQSREQIYELIDTMSQDSMISAVLETYAEDVCETNGKGNIVWCESADPDVAKMVSYLLDVMNVDKNIYKWVYSLIKYGDLYLKLFRNSDYEKDDIFSESEMKKTHWQSLNESYGDLAKLDEDIILNASSKDDHYSNYVENVANPGEMFELVKLGKTYGYVKAPVVVQKSYSEDYNESLGYNEYQFNKTDVTVYQASDFVHACLENTTSRTEETVTIVSDVNAEGLPVKGYTYNVKRGSSILTNVFKTWRELELLENAILLNRITKSAIVRLIQVEVGDMSKAQVSQTLQRLKSLIEQKSAINTGNKLTEYVNPGPIENNIYLPTHEGRGSVSTSEIGGDVDVKSLADVEHFQDELFGSLRVPKQYFAQTGDSAGFSGGTSLAIISSRYGKAVKRIQNTILQALSDAVNLMLLDRGLTRYINKFKLRMQEPTTQEEIDRREAKSNEIRNLTDIQNMLSNIDDEVLQIKIIKELLSDILSDSEILNLLDEYLEGKEEVVEEETEEDIDLDEEETTSRIELESPESEDYQEEEEADVDVLPTPGEISAGLRSTERDED